MCIIAIKDKRINLPSTKTLETMFRNNPDGAGFMYAKDGKVIIRKGFMNFKTFKTDLDKIDKNGDEYKAFHKKVEDLVNRENNREEANNKLVTENKQETKMVPVFSQQSQMLFNSITKN